MAHDPGRPAGPGSFLDAVFGRLDRLPAWWVGLGLVALTQSLPLLAFGVAGFVLAWSYSSPPLKLSYRGIGELSTFLAFGPIMTVGATVAFGTNGILGSFLASLILGFLAAGIF